MINEKTAPYYNLSNSSTRGRMPPECAGVYAIYDEYNHYQYSDKTLNLRKAYKKQKKSRNIPDGGRFGYETVKNGLTYDQLSYDERNKVNKYNPPFNPPEKYDYTADILEAFPSLEKYMPKEKNKRKDNHSNLAPNPKRHSLYQFLGYEKIDVNRDVYYLKEPKALFFMITEVIIKCLLVIMSLLVVLGLFIMTEIVGMFNQYVLLGLIAIPAVCYLLFHYIRRNLFFQVVSFFIIFGSAILYFSSYPLLQNWPFK